VRRFHCKADVVNDDSKDDVIEPSYEPITFGFGWKECEMGGDAAEHSQRCT
jgi:hypothetical protein